MSSPTLLSRLLAIAAIGLLSLIAAAPAAATPAGCVHEKRTATGAIDPAGICVSYGYSLRPAGHSGPIIRNIVASSESGEPMPFDYYVRSDIAQRIAVRKERPRGVYILIYGGAFICGSRADFASQARELARRGYIVVTPEYPLTNALSDYGNYHPNAPYQQGQKTQNGSNPCTNSAAWTQTAAWRDLFVGGLKRVGLEPALQEGQWVVQALIRTLKRDRTLGTDARRIFAIGSSAGGAVAIRLATGGNQDRLSDGSDPGDSTIKGAVSISGPACFPESTKITTPMLMGTIRPSELPACRVDVDKADPPFVMIQEPRGGANDPVTPSELLYEGCRSINNTGYAAGYGRRCIYEDRLQKDGGYIADGKHGDLGWSAWLRLFDVLGESGNFGQP